MSEQGLYAKVIPKVESQALDEFVNQLEDSLADASFNLNIKTSDSGTTTATVSSDSGKTASTEDAKGTKTLTKEDVAEATSKGSQDAHKRNSEDNSSNEKSYKSLLDQWRESREKSSEDSEQNRGMLSSVGSILSTGIQAIPVIGGALLSLKDDVSQIISRLKAASPLLSNILNLFSTAVNLFLAPIGTILGQELLPLARDLVKTAAEWQKIAYETYKKEGWLGLLREAFVALWNMFLDIWNDAVASLWEGIKQSEYIGRFASFVEGTLNFLIDNGRSMLSLFGTFLGLYIGYEMEKIATDALGIFKDVPGASLIAAGAGAAAGYLVADSILNTSGISEALNGVSAINDNIYTSNSSVSNIGASQGKSLYTSSTASRTAASSYTTNLYISGLTDDQLTERIKSEVSQQSSLARTRFGGI